MLFHIHTLQSNCSIVPMLEELKRYKLFCCGCGIGCLAECVATRPRVSV